MIDAESLVGVGSAFCFMLPVEGPVRRAAFAADLNGNNAA